MYLIVKMTFLIPLALLISCADKRDEKHNLSTDEFTSLSIDGDLVTIRSHWLLRIIPNGQLDTDVYPCENSVIAHLGDTVKLVGSPPMYYDILEIRKNSVVVHRYGSIRGAGSIDETFQLQKFP